MGSNHLANAGAIILALLDPDTAAEVLRRMRPEEVRLLLAGLKHLNRVEDKDIDQAAQAFLDAAALPERERQAGRIKVHQSRLADWFRGARVDIRANDPFWSGLAEADLCGQIRNAANNVAPKTLARWADQNADGPLWTLLAVLDPLAAGRLLSGLPAERAARVLKRLTVMVQVDSESLSILLNDILSLRVGGMRSESVVGLGESRALELLRGINPADRERILTGLSEKDAALAGRMQRGILKFDQLAQLSRLDLSLLLAGFSDHDIAVALKGKPATLVAAFLAAVSSGRRKGVEEEGVVLGPVRVSEQLALHDRITERALGLRETGRIVFPWEDQMVS